MARGDLRIPEAGEPEPSASITQAAAQWGFRVEAPATVVWEDEIFLWPENEDVFDLWKSVQSQWVREDGRIRRLYYPGVKICLDMWRGIKPRQRPAVWHLLQEMEFAALDEWSD